MKDFFKANLKVIITAFFLTLLVLHGFFPQTNPDAFSIWLFCLSTAPWLLPFLPKYIKSFKFPGGEITFNDSNEKEIEDLKKSIEDLKAKEPAKMPLIKNSADTPSERIQLPPLEDSGFSLIDLGNEIERRLRFIAMNEGQDSEASISEVLGSLYQTGVINPAAYNTFKNILQWRGQARAGMAVTVALAQNLDQLRKMSIEYINLIQKRK